MQFLFLSPLKLTVVLIQLMFLKELERSRYALLSAMSLKVTLGFTRGFQRLLVLYSNVYRTLYHPLF